MANLYFPQLSSGALVQYPIRKRSTIRTIKNILADGSMLVASDPGAGRLEWTLNYSNLQSADMQSLQTFFTQCGGPYRAFTFLDPTGNLCAYSADFTQSAWQAPAGLSITTGVADPLGGFSAFTVTNTAAANMDISQALVIPAAFQYCFSVYAQTSANGSCILNCSSANASNSATCAVAMAWSRLVLTGVLNDTGLGVNIGITLAPGQTLSLFGPQLEPQIAPSRYRATYSQSGVYPNAHWAVPELIFSPDGPNLFSTSFSIETTIGN